MRYFEFLNTLNIASNPLTDKEAGLIVDVMLLSTKPFSKPFKKLLENIRQQNISKEVSCFICYACADKDMFPEELWGQELVKCLVAWLHLAGIKVFIDEENSRFGNQIKPFMQQHIKDDDYIIIVGTKTLKAKLSSNQTLYNLKVEYEHVRSRIQEESNEISKASVIPIILSGKYEEALPDELIGALAIEDFSGNSLLFGQANIFIDHLQRLIAKLYNINLQETESSLTQSYKHLWKVFKEEKILQIGNQLGNLHFNPYLYLQQAKKRQSNFGKNKSCFSPSLAENQLDNYIGNTSLLERIINSINHPPAPKNTQVTVISGLGGMGKTHLAQQIMLNTKNVCKSVIWVNVESQISTNLYQKELEQLGFTAGSLPYIEQLKLFFDWLRDHPIWLLILDDVSNYEHIKLFIPPYSGHVIITSRTSEWPETYFHYSLDKLNVEDGRKLMKKHLRKRTLNDYNLDTLAEKLFYLPLALIQAAVYLAKNASTTIDYYIELYEQEPVELFEVYTEHKNVWQTLSISLEQVKNQSIESEELLYKCAVFGHMPLPLILLAEWIGCSIVKLSKLLSIPLSYYLIQPYVENNTVILHPIVGDILFAKLETHLKKDKIEEGLIFVTRQLLKENSQHELTLINYFFEMLQKIKIGEHTVSINPIVLAKALLATLPFLLKQDNMEAMINIEPQWRSLLDNEIILKNSLLHYQLLDKLLSFYTKKRDRKEFEFIEKKYNILNVSLFTKEIQLKVLVGKGIIAIELEHFVQAIAYFEEAINENLLPSYEQALAYANCCTAYIQNNNRERAIEMAKQGLKIIKEMPQDDENIDLRTYIKANLAEMHINYGELAEAEKLRQENIADSATVHSINGSRGKSWNYCSLAKIACKQGNLELARQRYEIFVMEMNKVFTSLNKWPDKYQNVAKGLDREIQVLSAGEYSTASQEVIPKVFAGSYYRRWEAPNKKFDEFKLAHSMLTKKEQTPDNQIIGFNRAINTFNSALQNYTPAIITNSEKFGLQVGGLNYLIIRAHQAQKTEDELIKEIKHSHHELNSYLNEKVVLKDSPLDGLCSLHWCAIYNYAQLSEFLISKGFIKQLESRNSLGLTPLQTAIVLGKPALFTTRFEKNPTFANCIFEYTNEKKESMRYTFNELSLALIGQQKETVETIFSVLKHFNKPINTAQFTDIPGIGNLLHLLIYMSLNISKQRDKQNEGINIAPIANIIDLLQLILKQDFSKDILLHLLTSPSNNHEGYPPLSLAAKYGQTDLLDTLIKYLKINVSEGSGLEAIQKAFYVAASHGQNEVVECLIHLHQFKPSNTHTDYRKTIRFLEDKSDTDSCYQMILGLIQTAEQEAGHTQYIKADSKTQTYENLVLAGGGGKGFIFPYALQALEHALQQRSQSEVNDFTAKSLGFKTIVRVAGTSAGAVFALAIALGYSSQELEDQLALDFAEFLESEHLVQVTQELGLDKPNHEKILASVLEQLAIQISSLKEIVGQVSNTNHPVLRGLWEYSKNYKELNKELWDTIAKIQQMNQQFKGFSAGDKAYAFLKQLFIKKGLSENLTFGELDKLINQDTQGLKGYKHLHVMVTNLSNNTFESISSENSNYSNHLILDAVRASMSFPIVFAPHRLRIKVGTRIQTLAEEYIDGGVLRNYPIDEFDFKRYTDTDKSGDARHPAHNKKTLGFRFKEGEVKAITAQAETLLSRLQEFFSLYYQAEALISAHVDKEYHRSIVLDTGNITTFTFKKLTAHEKLGLKQQADSAVGDYFKENRIQVKTSKVLNLPAIPKDRVDNSHSSSTEMELSQAQVSASKAKEQLFAAQLDDQLIQFTREQIKGDGNCGLTGLGTTRALFVETLLNLSLDKEARSTLYEEIYDALTSKDIQPPSDKWQKLLDGKAKAQLVLDESIRELREEIPEARQFEGGQLDELMAWLSTQTSRQSKRWVEKLKLHQAMISQIDEEIKDYCCDELMFKHYVNSFLSESQRLWIGHTSALLFAKVENITLFIWETESKDSLQLKLKNKHISLAPKNTIHLFYTGGSTHFDLLVEHSEAKNLNSKSELPSAAILLSSRHSSSFFKSSPAQILTEEPVRKKELFLHSKEGLKKEEKLTQVLQQHLPAGLKLGKAHAQGDCFFDSLAQCLNQMNNTDINTDKYLRMLCYDYYRKNKALVDKLNLKDYGGIDKQYDYAMVQYTVEECEQHFHGRSPIWGRPYVEGIILCNQLNLRGLCVIEILEHPETKEPIPSFHWVNQESYTTVDEREAKERISNPEIPTLVVEQSSLHFVPLISNPVEEERIETCLQTPYLVDSGAMLPDIPRGNALESYLQQLPQQAAASPLLNPVTEMPILVSAPSQNQVSAEAIEETIAQR